MDRGILSIYTSKFGKPRVLKLKPNTINMLTEHIQRHDFGLDDKIFPKSSTICNTYERLRTSLANKLHDSELKRIRLYNLRHYFASMLYYKSHDILLVKESLGHRNINNSLIYTHLIDFKDSDEWYSTTAKTVQEAQKLIEDDWQYIATFDNIMLFKKRK